MDNKLGRFDHGDWARTVDVSDRHHGSRLQTRALRAGKRCLSWRPGPQRLTAPHLQVWSGLLAAVALLALLLAFQQVVVGGVRQGELRQQAAAVLVDATWRCQALRGAELARQCLNGLAGLTDVMAPVELDGWEPARPAVLPRRVSLSDGVATRLAP